MSAFIMPINNPKVTSTYGWRTILGSKEWHQGVDLVDTKLGAKAPVYAIAEGVVSYTGELSSYGLVVRIKHLIDGVKYESLYAHLSRINVKVGQEVNQADIIGVIGKTGNATGVHLHAELHVNGYWSTGQPLAKDLLTYVNLLDTPSVITNNGGELTMSQYDELKKIIEAQNQKIKQLENKLANKIDALPERDASTSHQDAWEWLKTQAITNGTSPQAVLTREQFASLLWRYHKKFVK